MSVSVSDSVSLAFVAPNIYRGDTQPSGAQNGDLWIDTSTSPPSLKLADASGAFTPASASYTFEYISKNIRSWDAVLGWTGSQLSTITYTKGAETIVKTLNYTGTVLTSVVLSGDTPAGIALTKTLGYTSGKLTSVTYS
jgi:hypothetical protein